MEILVILLVFVFPIMLYHWVKALITKWVWNSTAPKMINNINKISTKQALIINLLKDKKIKK